MKQKTHPRTEAVVKLTAKRMIWEEEGKKKTSQRMRKRRGMET